MIKVKVKKSKVKVNIIFSSDSCFFEICLQTFSWYAKIRIKTDHMSDVSNDRFNIVAPLIYN
ncbi:hypothetical protein Hanom_Chr11g01043401 [Helianthus anomalus]